ncbi:MAG: tyrosine-type recombinase/integrase [Terriglobales bacterium]
MKANLRYQNGYLYKDHGSWYVRYRQRISQEDGSSKVSHVCKRLGRSEDFCNIFEVERCRAGFMQTVNRDRLCANSRITLTAFVEGAYLPWTKEERRASTSKGHHEIWSNHLRDRVGKLRLWEFRTVDASRMLRAIAKEKDLTKTTLQHIKSVLSTIFTYAKNEGAFDGANPVDGVLIPMHAREPGQTHAYDLGQVLEILDLLPLLAKSLVATAAFAGLRHGELRGLEWTDYTGSELTINRSIWMSVVNLPKMRASRDTVPVIPALAGILDEYRRSMGNPEVGVIFHSGSRLPINVNNLARRVIRPALEAVDLPWYGWHAFRRGLASNLYAMGAPDKVVQRVLRHSKPHVTKERYIKVFDRTVLHAVKKIQARIEELRQAKGSRQQLELEFGDDSGQPMTAAAESPTSGSLPHFSTFRPAVGQQNTLRSVGCA